MPSHLPDHCPFLPSGPPSGARQGAYRQWKKGEPVRLLLAGYNGARNTGSDVRAAEIARQAREVFGRGGAEITVMALDRKACLDLRSLPDAPSALFLSEENDAKVMTGILRSLSLLVTSRYHAAVLSMEGGCPITAVSMDERMIRPLLPSMVVEKTKDMVMVRGIGVGGTTTLATGNAVRCDDSLRALGIDLDGEFERLYADLPITTDHRARWTPVTKKMFSVFERMDLSPVVTPKFLDPSRCIQCGHCAIGCRVTSLKISGNAVAQVIARRQGIKTSYQADLVVLATGGLGTPVILKNSGIPCQDSLFADPVICVAGPLPGIRQDRQLLMPFISQQEGYILSPYMDYLSFFFNKDLRLPMWDLASVMIKFADEEKGSVDRKRIDKSLTGADRIRIEKAILQSREILARIGVPEKDQFLGTLNAGHPGGMLPLTAAEKDSLQPGLLPSNLYVADASLLPKALGNPPILTIMALAEKIASLL
ncbi:MAG: choline dehydrogenase [bacterium]